jgi:hypothetical protein
LPTSTRTVVFTDLANYTAKVAGSDREGLRRILQEHEALIAPIIDRNGGRVVKNLGDSFMCLFPSATDALRAALDVLDVVYNSGSMGIRLSMTTGDVEEIDGDAFGESANMAARINGKTPAGEVWFGPGTRVCMNAAEIPWESVGRFRLKGLPGEIELYRAVPRHLCWLPDPISAAVKTGNLVRFKRGSRPPLLPPEPVILFEGFTPGSEALSDAVASLPVIDPACLWLSTYNIAPNDRLEWTEAGRGLVIGTPDALEASVQEAMKIVTRTSGSDTIVLDLGVSPDLELVMCGLALPEVPLSDVVASYFYDLLPDGRWVNRSDRAILRVEVESSGVKVEALAPGVLVNGRAVASGDSVVLGANAKINSPAGPVEFRKANQGYAGVLLADSDMRLGITTGQTAELGREPQHPGLPFPDRRGQDNIRWCSGPRAAKARAGGFTLDRALAGRRQAAVQVIGDSIQITSLHPRCPTYVMRPGVNELELVVSALDLGIQDVIVAGTCVISLKQPEQ